MGDEAGSSPQKNRRRVGIDADIDIPVYGLDASVFFVTVGQYVDSVHGRTVIIDGVPQSMRLAPCRSMVRPDEKVVERGRPGLALQSG